MSDLLSDPVAQLRRVDGHWMRRLAEHYATVRRDHPDDELVVVFDIDGTIIDTRHLVRELLLRVDLAGGTQWFRDLRVDDIDVHEADIEPLLVRLGLDDDQRQSVLARYSLAMWTPEAVLAAHQPYRGVMEVMRWFQLQPRTRVALNTGRPDLLREPTRRVLRMLGDEYRVHIPDDLLLMNPRVLGEGVVDAKLDALATLRARGLRIVAVVDNEPENLEAMAAAAGGDDVLFLHASTIFLSARRPLRRSVTGRRYDLPSFVEPHDLARHVQLVCDEVTHADRLRRALAAPVSWVAVPVRADPYGRPEVDARRDRAGDLLLAEVLDAAEGAGKSVRLDLRDGAELWAKVAEEIDRHWHGDHDRLWIGGPIEHLTEGGVRELRQRYPQATLSCPVDFLAPLLAVAIEHGLDVLDALRSWGIDRVTVPWGRPGARRLLQQLEAWGREVDVSGAPDATSLLEAALLLPRSVTSAAVI